jgi:Na+/phosphate symporter
MINTFPIWLIIIDYIFGFIMIILSLKFILNLFINEDSKLSIFLFFNKLTSPIVNATSKITPNFIVAPLKPLYLAWIILMIRLYFLPILIGYSYLGTFAFVFEKNIISIINDITLNLALYLNYGI